jgi:hypothetical protein
MNAVTDQLIDAATARSLTRDVRRDHPLVGWIVVRDQPRPGEFIARLVVDGPTTYVIHGGTLAALRSMLPPGLEPSDRQPHDPPDLVEVWFAQ